MMSASQLLGLVEYLPSKDSTLRPDTFLYNASLGKSFSEDPSLYLRPYQNPCLSSPFVYTTSNSVQIFPEFESESDSSENKRNSYFVPSESLPLDSSLSAVRQSLSNSFSSSISSSNSLKSPLDDNSIERKSKIFPSFNSLLFIKVVFFHFFFIFFFHFFF
jgi:hypothetical protein